jgi:hypothetical protein
MLKGHKTFFFFAKEKGTKPKERNYKATIWRVVTLKLSTKHNMFIPISEKQS